MGDEIFKLEVSASRVTPTLSKFVVTRDIFYVPAWNSIRSTGDYLIDVIPSGINRYFHNGLQ